MRIADIVRRQAWARPHSPAIACEEATLTWSELDRRVDRLATVVADLAPGSRVAVLTRACHRHWEAIFACSRAGLIAVPLNYRWQSHEVSHVLEDCGAAGLVIDLSLTSDGDVDRIVPAEGLSLVLGFGGSHPTSIDYETALGTCAGTPPDRPSSPINVLGYTSGTTGRPKGAALTGSAAWCSALWFAGLFGLGPDARFLACLPIYVYRGGAGGLAPFVAGALTRLLDFDAERVVQAIERDAITHCILAPVMVERLLARPDIAARRLSTLRGVWVGGAPSNPDAITRLQALVGDVVGSVYGGTEATGIASMHWPVGEEGTRLRRSVGRAAPIMDVRLLDVEGTPVAEGEPGEIVVRGEAVMAGYWPDVPGGGLADGWYHTGDLAVRDNEGFVFLVDRSVDVVNSAGLNVYSTEVEQALLQLHGLSECAVVSAPDPALGETVAAFVVTDGSLTVAAIDEHCRAVLAGYKRPRALHFVDVLPRNAMGKVAKRELRERLWQGQQGTIAGAARADD